MLVGGDSLGGTAAMTAAALIPRSVLAGVDEVRKLYAASASKRGAAVQRQLSRGSAAKGV